MLFKTFYLLNIAGCDGYFIQYLRQKHVRSCCWLL